MLHAGIQQAEQDVQDTQGHLLRHVLGVRLCQLGKGSQH